MPKVSVIIVSYNSEDFIENCVNSVLKNLPKDGEVIVIDNASVDSTAEILEELRVTRPSFRGKSEELRLIKNKENVGFGKANNLAIKATEGEYLFFLNPDTEVKTKVFDELVSFYKKVGAGIVAPKLVMPNGQTQPSVRNLPTVWGAFKEYILGIKNAYSEYVPLGDEPIEVEMVYGAAMLIKKDLFEKIGGFDEKYFLYYEDVDLCKSVRKAGKKVYYYPGVSVKHLVGATSSNTYKINYDSSIKYHGIFKVLPLQTIFFLRRIFNKLK